jgi:hypothetical protein
LFFFILNGNLQKPLLFDFKYNIFSQNGEDGIIAQIFEKIGEGNKTCLEVGAANGLECSNTANLWINRGWKAILIECSERLFDKLKENVTKYKGTCTIIHRYIDLKDNSLDSILRSIKLDRELDLLSVDIDGNDYYIVAGMQIHPRVLICEFNPTLPESIDIYQDYGNDMLGSSVAALVRIVEPKGYKLVALTHCNCIFADTQEAQKLDCFETSLNALKLEDSVTYICQTLDSKLFLVKNLTHGGVILPFGIKKVGFKGKINSNSITRRVINIELEKNKKT